MCLSQALSYHGLHCEMSHNLSRNLVKMNNIGMLKEVNVIHESESGANDPITMPVKQQGYMQKRL